MVHLRSATIDDARFVWECRNDPDSRRESLDPKPIPFTQHVQWFQASLRNPLRRIWIAETHDGEAVGYGRLDWEAQGSDPTISVAVAPLLRRMGFGLQIVGLTTAMSIRPVWASIKTSNVASIKTFAAAGYQPMVTGTIQRWRFSP